MNEHRCDRCGEKIAQGRPRYIAKIEVRAAADPLEITEADLRRDFTLLREHLLEQAEAYSEEELMRDVHVEWSFTLCLGCQRTYLKNPLAK